MKEGNFFTEDELAASKYSRKIAEDLRALRLALQASTEFAEYLQNELNKAREPDQYWDAHDPEHEAMYDEQGIAELLFDRYPEGYRHTVVCAKRLPERTFKVWDDTDGTDNFVNFEVVK